MTSVLLAAREDSRAICAAMFGLTAMMRSAVASAIRSLCG